MIDRILKDLKDKHGVDIKRSEDIDALIRYVSHIKYNEGFTDGRSSKMIKKAMKLSSESAMTRG